MDAGRTFSEEELRVAGMRSVDALAEALARDDHEGALGFATRLRREVVSMIRNYEGWETTLVAFIDREIGEGQGAVAVSEIEDPEIAPERCSEGGDPVAEWRALAREVAAAIEDGEHALAIERAGHLHEIALVRHDRGMSRVSALLSWIGRRGGIEALGAALGEAMSSDMVPDASFRQRAEALMHFTRVHLQRFELVEDDEKLTFLCPVCPSGGRMIRAGHYEAPRNDLIVKGPHPLTYGRDEIPAYCCHEPVMETSSFEGTGVPMFIVDPAERLGHEPCKTYLYKRAEDIPERFFTRLGLRKP